MEITLVKTLSGFKACYDSDSEKAKKIPLNEPFVITYTKKRKIKFHRKFFALVNMVYQNQERYNSIDHLRKDLTIASGFYEIRYGLHGEEITEAKSISFANMTEEEFSELYSAFIDTVVKYFEFSETDIAENIEQFF